MLWDQSQTHSLFFFWVEQLMSDDVCIKSSEASDVLPSLF